MSDIPVYPWFDKIPEGAELYTRKQLAERGLRPGGPVRAQVVWRRGTRWADLYAFNEAKPKQQATEAQQAALAKAKEARSTCQHCKTVFSFVLPWGFECPECERRQWIADRDQTIETARQVLQDPKACFLDVETTSLDGYIVQIALIDAQGATLLDTLVNPLVEIGEQAFAVHGISAEQLVDAPTFAELLPSLQLLLAGRHLWIYNASFERGILANELYRIDPNYNGKLVSWLGVAKMRCAMSLYSTFVGEEHRSADGDRDYRWQALPGGDHSALGDCQATLRVVQRMAESELSTEAVKESV